MRSSAAPQLPRPRRCAWSSRARLLALGCAVGYFASAAAFAQLQWGTAGAGGTGTWDATTANWWNGTAQVPWTDGGTAVFGGTAGTVSVASFVAASKLVFTTPGYRVIATQGGISGFANTLTIDAQADVRTSSFSGFGTVTKIGAGKLTASGFSGFSQVRVSVGELELSGSLHLPPVFLSSTAGTTLTIAGSASQTVTSIEGGATSGGIIRPESTMSRTLTITNGGGKSFGGALMDNGTAVLSLNISAGTTYLTGVNTYSGPTGVGTTIVLNGGGRLTNSSPTVSGTLLLDNTTAALTDRLSDISVVTMAGGNLQMNGASATALSEVVGTLQLVDRSTVTVNRPDTALTELVFNGIDRSARGTVTFAGNGSTRMEGVTPNNGILGGWATVDADWATLDGGHRVTALTTYSSNVTAPTLAAHTRLTASAALSGDTVRLSLNLANSGAANALFDQAGHTLTLETGALLSGGLTAWSISGGSLSVGASAGNELIVTTQSDLTLGSDLVETLPGLGLTKTGSGMLALTGTNTMSGVVKVHEGVLAVAGAASLGQISGMQFSRGTFRVLSSFSTALPLDAIKGTALDTQAFTLTLTGPTTGPFTKIGSGTLVLTDQASFTSLTVGSGQLLIEQASGGSVSLTGGEVDVSGRLDVLSCSGSSFDIPQIRLGKDMATTLTTSRLSLVGSLTLEFELGSSGSDLLVVESTYSLSIGGGNSGQMKFRFLDLGGVETGLPYTLIDGPPSFGSSASFFGFASESLAEGWAGTFSGASGNLTVTFTSTPEPSAGLLLATAACGLLGMRRPCRTARPTS